MQRTTRTRTRKETFTISFRVGADHRKMLEVGAEGAGISVHEYARQLLLDTLEDTEWERLLYEVTELQGEIAKHRDEFARAVFALLAAIREPQKLTMEQAREWVQTNLRG